MKKFFKHIKGIISDGNNGTLSSKRIVMFLCVFMMVAGFAGNLFYGLTVAEHIYSAIMYVVVTGLGMTGLEKFAKPAAPSDPESETVD